MSVKIPLSRFGFFRTHDVDEARDALARVYAEGKLAPVGSSDSFRHAFNVAPVGRITLTAMHWGCGMTFRAPSLDGCFDFSSIVHGTSEIRIGRTTVDTDRDCGVVMSPSEELRIRWEVPLVSLNIKIDRAVLESHLAAVAGIELNERLAFSPAMPINGFNASVWRLVHHVVNDMDRDKSLLSFALVGERFSETLLTALLYTQPNNYSKYLTSLCQPSGPSYVRRAEEFMETHCDQPITTQSIANVVGVGVRTLFAGFKKHRNYTPMEFLRSVRLQRVRRDLLNATPGIPIGQIALKWGFTHLGRFSAHYREKFGESPSETLRHHSG